VALRLLAGDEALTEAVRRGELGQLREPGVMSPEGAPVTATP